jgi:DNA-directed RNA polymerase subunit RPC12/RpoP
MAKKSKKETKEETSTVEKKSIKKEKTKEEIEIEKITREKEKAINNKCPSCGAPIGFNPAVGKWKCEYCLSEFSIEDMQKYNNASSKEANDIENNENEEELDLVSYKCQNCGAEIVADENTAATFCVYCGSVAILKSKLSGKFAPNFVIPFKKTKEEAIQAFINISKGRPLCPKDFNDKKNIEKIKGVYIPFWLHTTTISGNLNATATRVQSWSSGDYRYTKTDYFKLYRSGSVKFIRIPADGSKNFDDDIMNSLEPFDYNQMIKYNHAYLSGFYAEKYDVPSEESLNIVNNRALNSTRSLMYNISSFANKVITEDTLAPTESKIEYALLPVWMVNVKYGDKTYIFAMNGESGKFIGDIPLDKKKRPLYAIAIFSICFIILYFLILIGMG